MARYVAKRLATSIGLLFLSSIVIFCLMRVIPGDPTITKVAASIKEVDAEHARADPARARPRPSRCPHQYLDWIGGVLHGDFGSSYFSQFPVTTLIGQRIGATLQLALSRSCSGSRSRCRGVAGADLAQPLSQRRRSPRFTAVGMSIPAFVIGIALIIIFGVKLDVLPTQGYVSFQHDPVESVQIDAPARAHARDRRRRGRRCAS